MTDQSVFPNPVSDTDWPAELDDLRGGFTGTANVYRTMAHHPALLRAWQDLRRHVVTQSSLSPEQLEIVILRTGHRLNATYEWTHHIVRGRKAGLTDARIAATARPVEEMAPSDALLAGAVDSLISDARLSPDERNTIVKTLGVAGLFDLMATVGFYSTLAYIVNTCETSVDVDITKTLRDQPFDSRQL